MEICVNISNFPYVLLFRWFLNMILSDAFTCNISCFVLIKIRGGLYDRVVRLTNFQTYFTVRIRTTFVVILSLKNPPHLKCVATLHCENKTTSVTTNFKELTTGNNVFMVSVIIQIMQFYIKCSMCTSCLATHS